MPILAFLGPLITKAMDLIPDPQERAKQQLELMTALQQWDAQQAEVNKVEAASNSLFVAGWRPFIGWVCGGAFAYKFLLQPMLIFVLVASGSSFDYTDLPVLDWSEMGTILLGMLGIGGMRSLEKIRGVA